MLRFFLIFKKIYLWIFLIFFLKFWFVLLKFPFPFFQRFPTVSNLFDCFPNQFLLEIPKNPHVSPFPDKTTRVKCPRWRVFNATAADRSKVSKCSLSTSLTLIRTWWLRIPSIWLVCCVEKSGRPLGWVEILFQRKKNFFRK